MRKLLAALLGIVLAMSIEAQQRVRISYTRHRAITPSDTVLVVDCQRIYIGGAGNIVIEDSANTQITYTVVAGAFLDFAPFRIRATGTTATAIACWY